jgi:hypothetical protein
MKTTSLLKAVKGFYVRVYKSMVSRRRIQLVHECIKFGKYRQPIRIHGGRS